MSDIIWITPQFAVSGEITPEDLKQIAAQGFRAVINNRPDGEDPSAARSDEFAKAAEENGLAYRYIPTVRQTVLTDAVAEQTVTAFQQLDGPILAHCKSGQRSAMAWAAATARTEPVDEILAKLKSAGLNLESVRGELEDQSKAGSMSK